MPRPGWAAHDVPRQPMAGHGTRDGGPGDRRTGGCRGPRETGPDPGLPIVGRRADAASARSDTDERNVVALMAAKQAERPDTKRATCYQTQPNEPNVRCLEAHPIPTRTSPLFNSWSLLARCRSSIYGITISQISAFDRVAL